MLLSNPRPFFLLVIATAWLLASCGSSPNTANNAQGSLPATMQRFPFGSREPQAYQAEVVVTVGGAETKWFVARRGEYDRIDIGRGTPNERIEIHGPRSYTILPGKMIYAEILPDNSRNGLPGPLEQISRQYFAGAEYRKFEAAGSEGALTKYIAGPDETSVDTITVWFDSAAGVIVKQEIASSDGRHKFVFELRGLILDAGEQLFSVPTAAKKVSLDEIDRSN